MIKKNRIIYFIFWFFLMIVTFFVSYSMNVARIYGTDQVTGKDFGGLTINWINITLLLVAVSVAYVIIIWKKLK